MARASKKSGSKSESKPAAPADGPASSGIRPLTLVVSRVLLCLALGISAYLAWVSFSHGAVVGCGPESDCDRVLQSRWSRWFGVPVSAFAVLVDALALWGTFALGGASATIRSRGGYAAALGSMLILGAGLWFVTLQVAAVGICPYCMTAHGAGMTAAIVLLLAISRSGQVRGLMLQTAPVAGGMLAVLFAGQFLQKAPGGRESKISVVATNLPVEMPAVRTQSVATTSVTQTQENATGRPVSAASNSAPAVTGSNAVAAGTTNPVRQTYTADMGPVSAMKQPFTFYEGLFGVDLQEVPIVGAATNARVVVSLFDYSCHSCRQMYPVLEEVQRLFSNSLVIVSLPMPLDEKCNHTLKRTSPAHSNACAYARLGLAVWRANRARHAEFDEWLMSGTEPPSVQAAVLQAMSLVGSNAFAAAVNDPWVSRQVQFDVAIYDVAYRSGHGAMPQLVVGNSISEGVRTREDILKMLADQFGLKPKP